MTPADLGATPVPGGFPVIETERLILRAHTPDDYADCCAMWADPAIVRFIGGKPFTPVETWTKMLRYRGMWQLVGFGYWAIEDRATRCFAGELGFADFKRTLEPSLEGRPELGWVLAARFHGRGYATEAVRGVTAWGDGNLGGRATACIIDPDNTASLRVAQTAGYREFARATYGDSPVVVFTRAAGGRPEAPLAG